MARKRKGVREYKVWNHVYGFELSMFFTDTMQEFLDDIYPGDYNMKSIIHHHAATFCRNGDIQRVVFERLGLTFGIVAHESKHVVNSVFEYIGMKLDPINDEAECYLLQWVVNHIHQAIHQDGTRIKPNSPSQVM